MTWLAPKWTRSPVPNNPQRATDLLARFAVFEAFVEGLVPAGIMGYCTADLLIRVGE